MDLQPALVDISINIEYVTLLLGLGVNCVHAYVRNRMKVAILCEFAMEWK